MWLPSRVEPRHKVRGYLLWAILLLLLLGYTSWEVWIGLRQRSTPSIGIRIEDDAYRFPDITVCMLPVYGCDTLNITDCAASTIVDAKIHHVFPIEGFLEPEDRNISAVIHQDFDTCLFFETSKLTVDTDHFGAAIDIAPEISLLLQWTVNFDNTVPIGVTRSSVRTFLSSEHAEHSLDGAQVDLPYNRLNGTDSVTNLVSSSVNIGLSETKRLSGETSWDYHVTAISHSDWVLDEELGKSSSQENTIDGALYVNMFQPRRSHTVFEEIDPVQWSTVLGTVGGAWELMLIVWGIFFISRFHEEPDLKARNFFKSTIRGKDAAVSVASSIIRKRTMAADGSMDATVTTRLETGEALPSWERSKKATTKKADGILIRLFERQQLVAFVNASSIRAFLQREHNATHLRHGASHPLLKRLLPPNTWLAVVPNGSSVMAVVRSVVDHCNTGSSSGADGRGSRHKGSGGIAITVKRARCSALQSEALAASGYLVPDDDTDEESDVEPFFVDSKVGKSKSGGRSHGIIEQDKCPSFRTALRASGGEGVRTGVPGTVPTYAGASSSRDSSTGMNTQASRHGAEANELIASGRQPQSWDHPRPTGRPFQPAGVLPPPPPAYDAL